jgi:hypothetical protein
MRLTPLAQGLVWGHERGLPRTILELEERFSTEEACRDYLLHLRWPDGFIRRTSKSRGKLFYGLLQHAVQVAPVPHQTLLDEANAQRKNHNL